MGVLDEEEYIMDVPGLMEQPGVATEAGDLCELSTVAAALDQGRSRDALGVVREEEEGGGGGGGGEAGEGGGGKAEGGEEEGEGRDARGGRGAGEGGGEEVRGGHECKAAQRATEAKTLEEQMLAAEEGLVEAMAHRALTEIKTRRQGGPAYRRITAGTGEDPEWATMWVAKAVAREELNALRKEVDVADFALKGKEWRSSRMKRIWMAAVEAVDRELPSLPCPWERLVGLSGRIECAALAPFLQFQVSAASDVVLCAL